MLTQALQYDTLTVPSNPLHASLTSDGGIVYTDWNLATHANNSLPGVISFSPPNRAVYSAVLDGGQASISVPTNYTCLKLEEFYLGYSAHTDEGQVNLALKCTVTLKGFDNDNKSTGIQIFEFTPNGPLLHLGASSMQKYMVSSIEKPKTIQFSTTGEALVVALFDNVKYKMYKDLKTCQG